MNQLINDIFGDGYITLTCEGGECLHFSQVPGYVSPPKPDNTRWIALSIAGAGLVVVLSTIGACGLRFNLAGPQTIPQYFGMPAEQDPVTSAVSSYRRTKPRSL